MARGGAIGQASRNVDISEKFAKFNELTVGHLTVT